MSHITNEKDLKTWCNVSDFFLKLYIQIELDYLESKISRIEKNKKIKKIKKDWDYSMLANNPFLKNIPKLRKVANHFL